MKTTIVTMLGDTRFERTLPNTFPSFDHEEQEVSICDMDCGVLEVLEFSEFHSIIFVPGPQEGSQS